MPRCWQLQQGTEDVGISLFNFRWVLLFPRQSPLKCILDNWDQCDPQSLKQKWLIFFCNTAWTQYCLQSGESWPLEGSINCNTLLQLDLFCSRKGKWIEVPHVQVFFSLWDNPQLCKACNLCPTGRGAEGYRIFYFLSLTISQSN